MEQDQKCLLHTIDKIIKLDYKFKMKIHNSNTTGIDYNQDKF